MIRRADFLLKNRLPGRKHNPPRFGQNSCPMKKIFLFSFALFLAAPVFAQKKSGTAAPKTTLDLKEAIAQKLVRLDIECLGGYRGEVLKVTCKNLTTKSLRVQIPQGQMMNPADSTWQTLVVAESKTLNLGTKNPVQTMLKTFCAEAGDGSPATGAAFSVGILAPEAVRKMLQFIVERGKVDDPAAQQAVWCVANGNPLGGIGDAELTKFAAELLGKTLPGYRIKYKVTETPGARQALGPALKVEGNYIYFLEKTEQLSLTLFDTSGKTVKTLFKNKEYSAGEHRSSLNLEVWNLKPGKYFLRLQTAKGETVKEIEVEF